MSGFLSAGIVGGSDIPDSVVHQYTAENFNSPWADNVGSANMSVNGLFSSTFSNGEESVESNEGDSGTANGPEQVLTSFEYGVAFTVQYQDADFNGNDSYFGYFRSDTGGAGGANGNIGFIITDDGGSRIRGNTNSTFGDGTPRAVVINKTGDSATDIDIYVDDMSNIQSMNIIDDQNYDSSNHTQSNIDFYGDAGYMAGVFEFHGQPLNLSERNDFLSRRSEV